MPDGGKVRITLQAQDDGVELTVSDTGTGIPESEREKIFELFYTTKQHGTGIGLTLVRTIADLHGGTVTHHPRDGGGTVFVLSVPVEWERRAGSVGRRLTAY